MSHDTSLINKQRQDLSAFESVWLFGYGSLIYKVDFPYLERKPATITGWSRRFWQGSHDHRGTPDAPGRVLTLIETPGEKCTGMAYRVSPEVFEHLDHREKNGYLRFFTPMLFADGQQADGLVYIASSDNAAFLGDAPLAEIAQHIVQSRGPSGENSEYLLKLSQGLRNLGVTDPHVEGIRQHLEPLLADQR
ncbi:gamma-glutamylcyclotransferase [Idiomarina sp. UBA3162]|uniref:gamma-glutamylcyclotransferase n=1 Tax=Idiomarina sp. UBA3162 TaxID=1946641 RepID=UPI000C8BBE02|nr:gamma-glutamylcyclotransferase [Idiomarina sp. UBA3162]MAD54240.1 gamma-glutamylcyclotransferase [Idiomarinaceae bacterium]|tara:strand:+ start:4605 stop:5180 length:576 start_codon:yes stop_codon:yes gene_type:complete